MYFFFIGGLLTILVFIVCLVTMTVAEYIFSVCYQLRICKAMLFNI